MYTLSTKQKRDLSLFSINFRITYIHKEQVSKKNIFKQNESIKNNVAV